MTRLHVLPGLIGGGDTDDSDTINIGLDGSYAATEVVTLAASDANPQMDGTAAPGTAVTLSRADHVHPSDTSRAAVAGQVYSGTHDFSAGAVLCLRGTIPGAQGSFGVMSADDKFRWRGAATNLIALDTVTAASTYAPIASPTLTGDPKAPTPAADDNDTSIATTAYVIGQAGSATPIIDGTGAAGTSTRWARQDHVHPTDTSRAALASPTFTGTPAAPTAAQDTNTTQLATTAYVVAQAGSAAPIIDGVAAVGTSLRYARQDHVHPTDTTRSPLASPTFTGTPAAPTPTSSDNSTTLATTAFVKAAEHLIYIGSFTASASASLATAAFSAGTYAAIIVVYMGIIPATSAANLQVQLRGGGTTPLQVASTGATGTGAISGWAMLMIDNVGNGTNFFHHGSGYFNQAGTGIPATQVITVGAANSNAPTTARILMSSGNITSGTAIFFGLRNAT